MKRMTLFNGFTAIGQPPLSSSAADTATPRCPPAILTEDESCDVPLKVHPVEYSLRAPHWYSSVAQCFVFPERHPSHSRHRLSQYRATRSPDLRSRPHRQHTVMTSNRMATNHLRKSKFHSFSKNESHAKTSQFNMSRCHIRLRHLTMVLKMTPTAIFLTMVPTKSPRRNVMSHPHSGQTFSKTKSSTNPYRPHLLNDSQHNRQASLTLTSTTLDSETCNQHIPLNRQQLQQNQPSPRL